MLAGPSITPFLKRNRLSQGQTNDSRGQCGIQIELSVPTKHIFPRLASDSLLDIQWRTLCV